MSELQVDVTGVGFCPSPSQHQDRNKGKPRTSVVDSVHYGLAFTGASNIVDDACTEVAASNHNFATKPWIFECDLTIATVFVSSLKEALRGIHSFHRIPVC